MSHPKLKTIEAILFAAGNRISVARLCELAEVKPAEAEKCLQELVEKYNNDPNSTFELVQMGTDWKFTVKRDYLPIVEKIAPDTELTKTVIETLAILAWKAPMMQSDLVKIRSNKAYDHIAELRDRGFIEKQSQGRTYLLKLTSKFFDYFDISGREDFDKVFDPFEGKDQVDTAQIDEHAKAEEQRKKEELEKIAEQPTLDDIQSEEREKQKEFFDNIDQKFADVTERSEQVISEIQSMKPDDLSDEELAERAAKVSVEDETAEPEESQEEISEEEKKPLETQEH